MSSKQEVKNPETKVSGAKKTAPAAPALNDKTVISVKSLVDKVFYTCNKTYDSFSWFEAGDVEDMTFQQLKIMKTMHPRFFTEKWIIPLNEEVIAKLGLADIYISKLNKYEYAKLYGDDAKVVEGLIKGLNEKAKAEIKESVIKDVKNGKISNAKIIRILEKTFDEDLMQYV